MSLQRNKGSRLLSIAVFVAIILFYYCYSRFPHSSWSSSSIKENTKPDDPLEESLKSPSSFLPQSPLEDHPSCPIIKVSMLYGAHNFPELRAALDSHRQHCDRWGCHFVSLKEDLSNRKLYSKHYFLMSTLLNELSKPAEERKQWLMWVDADSILINPAISPCAFLPPDNMEYVYALITADHQGLNNGVFYLRVHQDSLDLLTQIADYPLAHPDEDLGWFGEQRAMENVIYSMQIRSKNLGTPSGIVWVPRPWFNAFEWEHAFEGRPGHFMVHFAGLAETRLTHMANWHAELQSNQAKWEIPLDQTFYADAIPEFWNEFAANATKRE